MSTRPLVLAFFVLAFGCGGFDTESTAGIASDSIRPGFPCGVGPNECPQQCIEQAKPINVGPEFQATYEAMPIIAQRRAVLDPAQLRLASVNGSGISQVTAAKWQAVNWQVGADVIPAMQIVVDFDDDKNTPPGQPLTGRQWVWFGVYHGPAGGGPLCCAEGGPFADIYLPSEDKAGFLAAFPQYDFPGPP